MKYILTPIIIFDNQFHCFGIVLSYFFFCMNYNKRKSLILNHVLPILKINTGKKIHVFFELFGTKVKDMQIYIY